MDHSVIRPSVRAVAASIILGTAGCTVSPTITELTPASRGSVYGSIGQIDPSNACTPNPTPAAPNVMAAWNQVDPTTRRNKVITGFEAWSNANAGCASFRQDSFRGLFAYPLSSLAALSSTNSPISSRISTATLRFSVNGLSASRSSLEFSCASPIGGVAGIAVLRPNPVILSDLNAVVPPETINDIGAGAAQIESFGTEFAPLPVPGTRGRATFSVGGGGVTIVEIDVKDRLIGALNRGDTTLGFMLFGPREALQTPSGDVQLDCKMLVTPEMLTVKSL